MAEGVDPQVERAQARVGKVLRDKWTLERLLGVGGMAAVYVATHRNGLRGALKLLHPELNALRDAKERFLREGYAANKVGHPGAVRVLDDDAADDGSVFLVMELLEGQTVDARAAACPGGRMPAGDVLAVADMALDVLAAAHDKGIVHRDLKPENLFLTTAGDLRVLDFGIARVRELGASSRVTQTGAAMGTPAFMAPEQASGQWNMVDARTDLWAIGATMFSLLTGRLVHEAATLQLLLADAIMKPAPPLRSIEPSVPPDVAQIVDRALAFDRDRRWPDARAMQKAVRAARSGAPLSALGPLPSAGREPALAASNPTTSPVSTLSGLPKRASSGGRALAVAGAGVAVIGIVAAAWIALRGTGGGTPAAAIVPAAVSEAPALVSAASAAPTPVPPPTVAPAVTASAAEEPSAEPPATAQPAQPTARPTARPLAPAPSGRAKSTSPTKHPGIY